VIIGAGPAGLVLGNVLRRAGIGSVILERSSREHIESRGRAGLIDHHTVQYLAEQGLADGLLTRGARHDSCEFRFGGNRFSVPYGKLTDGCAHQVYPQQFLVADLIESYLDGGGTIHFETPATAITGLDGRPVVDSGAGAITCDFVAGCDGFHGLSRSAIPADKIRVYERAHEFGWLAILAEAPPSTTEIIYALHPDGFAGHMLRTATVSRYYLQCPVADDPANWPDELIWSELHRRLATNDGWRLNEGPITEKAVLEMRSWVTEPMRYGNLFLLGDAAHIITPAGAKGMNLAIADARVLASALRSHYEQRDDQGLRDYSATCLERVWRAQEFSHWMLHLLHRPQVPTAEQEFLHRLQLARLTELAAGTEFAVGFAHNYVGAR
jgi:p-hydroxybenzoate 3-monooxygenase